MAPEGFLKDLDNIWGAINKIREKVEHLQINGCVHHSGEAELRERLAKMEEAWHDMTRAIDGLKVEIVKEISSIREETSESLNRLERHANRAVIILLIAACGYLLKVAVIEPTLALLPK